MYSLQITGLLLIITAGRLVSIAIGVLGIISLVIARRALARSSSSYESRRTKAIAALITGLTVVVLSLLQISLSTGGFGTGSGKLGAIVAMIFGLSGAWLGSLALARLKRTAK